MPAPFPPSQPPGQFVGTTNIWDVQRLYDVDVNKPEFKELLVRLYQNINLISVALNAKVTGYYPQFQETQTGAQYFAVPNSDSSLVRTSLRNVFRTVVVTGQLPNTGTISIPHDIAINDAYMAVQVYGAATDTTGLTLIPLPYSSPTLADNIEVNVDSTNVNITTGSDRTNYDLSQIVIEYIKQQ